MLVFFIYFIGDYMTINDLIKIVNGESKLNSDLLINKIKTDSRKIEYGDVFVALKGLNYNGNLYVLDALKNGAIACIVDDNIDYDNCIKVSDTYKSLFYIGNYIRNKYNIPLIAITGSNGKTTTKDLITHILESEYKVLKNDGSKNNLIGISNTLFKLNNEHEIIVMELGSNHLGEISYLSKMCNPTYSVITNIGSSHIGYFKTKRNIFKEKISILDGMKEKKLIINGDDKYLNKIKCYKCGINKKNNLIAYNIHNDINNVSFNIYLDKEYKIKFNNPGKHFINDILLAIKVCLDYGVNIETITERINNFTIAEKRMNLIKCGNNTILSDCYNSSYESIKAGLDSIKNIKCNKVLIIGDILELGKYSKRIHKRINKLLNNIENKEVLTVGIYSKYIKGKNFLTPNELINYLNNNPINNSLIYIKASRKIGLDAVVKYLQKK